MIRRYAVPNVCVAALLLVCAVVASVSLIGGAASASSLPQTPAHDAPVDLRDNATIREALTRQHSADAADRQDDTSASAARDRDASRTRYDDLTTSEAISATRDEAPEIVADNESHLPLKPGDTVLSYGDSSTAMTVRAADGSHDLIDSPVPLRAEDDSGHLARVDLSVDDHGDWFAPVNPQVLTKFPGKLSDGIALGTSGLVVTPVGSAGAAGGRQVGDAVFYANAGAADTDFIVRPVDMGIETFHQLRSPDSPEELSFRFAAHGEPVELRQNADGTFTVLQGGIELAVLTPPIAKDAHGTDVPASAAIDGSVLTLTVKHRGADVAYPIEVDPTIYPVDDHWNWQGDPNDFGDPYAWNWAVGADPSVRWDNGNPKFAAYYGDLFGYRGLHTYDTSNGGIWWYNDGDGSNAYWYYHHYGATTRIQELSLGNWVDLTDHGASVGTCLWAGLWDVYQPGFESPGISLQCHSLGATWAILDATSGHTNNYAFVGMLFNGSGWRQGFWSYVGAATVRMDDYTKPYVAWADIPSTVTDPQQTVGIGLGDDGFGVQTVKIWSDVPGWGKTYGITSRVGAPTCLATPRDPCPPTQGTEVQIGDMPTGQHFVYAQASDKAGNVSDVASWSVNVDAHYASHAYGGSDATVNTDDEAALLGRDLATGTPYPQNLWGSLSVPEKNYMMTAEDPWFASWAPRIDTVAPSAVSDIDFIDNDASDRTATIAWSEGSDPDISSGVYGSGVDALRWSYRYQRAGSSWSSWNDTDTSGFDISSVDPGDVLTVEAREFDRAGNVSPVESATLTVPDGPVAHGSFFAIPVIACLEWCPVAAAGIYAGTSYFWHVHDQHFDWDSVASNHEIQITSAKGKPQSFKDAEAGYRAGAKSGKFRRDGGNAEPGDHSDDEAHHVVAAGAAQARYARWVFYRCGLDPNNWEDNGLWLPKQFHRRMHTKSYYEAINDMLRKYDPDLPFGPGNDPCGQNEEGSLTGNGLRKAMQDIKAYILRGEMP